jgi:general secretion pathway protein H
VKGFTLLEIMVVITIIAIITSFIMISLEGRDLSVQQENEAQRLTQTFRLAREEAILNNQLIGLRFRTGCYTFMQQINGEWKPYNERILGPHEIPSTIRTQLIIDGLSVSLPSAETANDPQILIWPSGEVTAFEIRLESNSEDTSYQLIGNNNGEITLSQG